MPHKKLPAKKTKKQEMAKKKQAIAAARASNGLRLRKLNRHQRKHKEKTAQRSGKLPNAWRILIQSLQHLYKNKKLFGGILLVYGVLYILFVKGISANFQLGSLRQSLQTTFSGKLGGFSTGIALYGLLLGSAGSGSSDVSGAYQTIIVIVMSLALIWALRSTYSKKVKLRVRDSFYKSMYPLVPFVIVCLVIVVQTLPALIVTSLYSIVQSNSLAVGSLQMGLAVIVLVLGLLWTLYMLSSSLFALYIVTLPDSAPIAALKAARKLVRYRRWILLRKVLFLPLMLLIFSAIVLIPLILFIPTAAEILFMIFSIVLLGVVHSYFYTLYRSLL